jgi:hypothetical protein
VSGGDPQYVQLPADPRVLSGQCSYAIIPQNDGTSQIVLIENTSLGGSNGTSNDEVVELECPPSTIFDNEYEGEPWSIDITLMYADSPLTFTSNNSQPEEKAPEDKTPLRDLLQDIDKELTLGWWTVNSTLQVDHLLRALTLR